MRFTQSNSSGWAEQSESGDDILAYFNPKLRRSTDPETFCKLALKGLPLRQVLSERSLPFVARSCKEESRMRLIRSGWVWVALWVFVMGATVFGMQRARDNAVNRFSSPDQVEAWEKWVQEAEKQGPVARRRPKSSEPPTLRLLRDHYTVCLGGMLVFETAILGFLGILLYGVLNGAPTQIDLARETTSGRGPSLPRK